MFKVIIKTLDKETILRTDVINYVVSANVMPVMYTTNSISNPYYSAPQQPSVPRPIVNYNITIFASDGKHHTFIAENEQDANDFVDKLAMAEEEQLTSERLSMDDLYQYAAEKLLGGRHEDIPGFKIPKIEVKASYVPENLAMMDEYDKYADNALKTTNINKHYGGGGKYGFGV